MTRREKVRVVPLFIMAHCAVVLMAGLTSCTKDAANTQTFLIDEYLFDIPHEYLLPSQVDWFPMLKPSGNGVVFRNDSALPLTEQFAITLESRKITCRPDKLTPGSMLASACSGNTQAQRSFDVSELRKEFTYPDNDAFWHYTMRGTGASRTIVASCYAAASSKANDTCSAFGWYKSLVYSFSIKDRNIAHLNERRAYIESLLSSWERR